MTRASLLLMIVSTTIAGSAPATSVLTTHATTTASKGRDCINSSRIVSRRAVTADTFEVTLVGGQVYRSVISQYCPHLAEIDRTFTLQFDQQQGSRICAGDRFRIIDPVVARAGGTQGFPLCRFGRFVPVD